MRKHLMAAAHTILITEELISREEIEEEEE
jgi:acyl CoA:acetate/3-ketoacid CoA transferase alpha subunit